jgi:hypothetical protein
MRAAARAVLLVVVLSARWCAVVAETAWSASEMLALCDGTDFGLPCEKLVDPRQYLACKDARCHKPGEEFGSSNACGRARPGRNEIPIKQWTEASLERFRVRGKQKKGARATHGEL